MELPKKVRLIRCSTNDNEAAEFDSLDRTNANQRIDSSWWSDLESYSLISDPDKEPDRHWDWRAICSKAANKPGHEVRCIRTGDKNVQVAASFIIGLKSYIEPGEKAIYLDRLATAPWNRGWLVQNPQYNRGGYQMMRCIVETSYLLGLKGRVNLTAVASQDFYLSLGFRKTQGQTKDGIIYELSTDAALRLIDDRRRP